MTSPRQALNNVVIAMEACASAHYWAGEPQARGYHVKLIAAQSVKPYVKINKKDRTDAEAIFEALGRPNMWFVAVKTVDQQDIQATHRIREELISQRTVKANQNHGFVAIRFYCTHRYSSVTSGATCLEWAQ